jgi:hypothetical protein
MQPDVSIPSNLFQSFQPVIRITRRRETVEPKWLRHFIFCGPAIDSPGVGRDHAGNDARRSEI